MNSLETVDSNESLPITGEVCLEDYEDNNNDNNLPSNVQVNDDEDVQEG